MAAPSGVTPQYGLPYLLETDVPDVAAASQLLAQAVENLVKNMRVGVVEACFTTTAPTGAVLLQGQAVTRTGTYAALFAKWGTKFGTGNGSTTFNLPDTRAKVLAGYKSGTSTFGTLGASVGSNSQTLVAAQIPHLTVSVTDSGHVHAVTDPKHQHLTYALNTSHLAIYTATSTSPTRLETGASGNGTYVTWNATNKDQLASTGISVSSHTTGITAAVGTVSNTPVSVVQASLVTNFFAWYK